MEIDNAPGRLSGGGPSVPTFVQQPATAAARPVFPERRPLPLPVYKPQPFERSTAVLDADLRTELARRETSSEGSPTWQPKPVISPEMTEPPSGEPVADAAVKVITPSTASSEFRLASGDLGITYVNMRPFERSMLNGGASGLMPS